MSNALTSQEKAFVERMRAHISEKVVEYRKFEEHAIRGEIKYPLHLMETVITEAFEENLEYLNSTYPSEK